ncbi:MAG: hypothetical protein AAFZ18_13300 [Myxococcota bacterium]
MNEFLSGLDLSLRKNTYPVQAGREETEHPVCRGCGQPTTHHIFDPLAESLGWWGFCDDCLAGIHGEVNVLAGILPHLEQPDAVPEMTRSAYTRPFFWVSEYKRHFLEMIEPVLPGTSNWHRARERYPSASKLYELFDDGFEALEPQSLIDAVRYALQHPPRGNGDELGEDTFIDVLDESAFVGLMGLFAELEHRQVRRRRLLTHLMLQEDITEQQLWLSCRAHCRM